MSNKKVLIKGLEKAKRELAKLRDDLRQIEEFFSVNPDLRPKGEGDGC